MLFNIGPTVVDILVAVVFFMFTFNILLGLLVLATMVFYMGEILIQFINVCVFRTDLLSNSMED